MPARDDEPRWGRFAIYLRTERTPGRWALIYVMSFRASALEAARRGAERAVAWSDDPSEPEPPAWAECKAVFVPEHYRGIESPLEAMPEDWLELVLEKARRKRRPKAPAGERKQSHTPGKSVPVMPVP